MIIFSLQCMPIRSQPGFAVVPRLNHLFLISLSTLYLFSFPTGQVSHPCNILLHTQLLYSLPLIINDISTLVSKDTNCLNYTIQFAFWSQYLHQNLHQHSTCHVNSKNLSINSRFSLAPISTLVQPVLVTGFKQPLQINDFITLYMLPFRSLHFLCNHSDN